MNWDKSVILVSTITGCVISTQAEDAPKFLEAGKGWRLETKAEKWMRHWEGVRVGLIWLLSWLLIHRLFFS